MIEYTHKLSAIRNYYIYKRGHDIIKILLKIFMIALFFTSTTKLLRAQSPIDNCGDCSIMNFGTEGSVIYNTETGTLNILYGEDEIVSDAYALVLNGNNEISSKDYLNRTITKSELNDVFGLGHKLEVSLTAEGLPDMHQIFYTYDGLDYFFTEVTLTGINVASNYMAPLISNNVNIKVEGDNRVLFVPFDNDTFIRYGSKSMKSMLTNTSSEVTAFYDNDSRRGLVVGSVEQMVWKTGVRATGEGPHLSEFAVWGGYTDKSVTRDEVEHGTISGGHIKSPKIFIGLFDDWRAGLEEYGKSKNKSEPRYIFNWENPTPFGWNSWGAIQSSLNLDNAKAVANFFSTGLPEFRNGETAYIDLDSYWDNLISGGLEGDFTQLVAFVRHCREKGLTPGIYWAPFVDWGKSERKVEGSGYNYSEAWTKVNGEYHDLDGCRAMDPTHPATQQRINLVIDKFKACGFEMIKIDFIGHAAIEADEFYDKTVKTGMEAFRKGMEYLVDRLEGKMLVYTAISPNLATSRYTHMRRIACDAYADINATQYTLNSNTYGWWQGQIYNYIDGDHLVFGNATLGENKARLTSGIINGPLITGDDYSKSGQWTDRSRTLLQNKDILDIARNGLPFRPVEGNSEDGASEVFVQKVGNDYYVAVLNYGNEKKYDLDFTRLGLEAGGYKIKELFSGNSFNIDGKSLQVEIGSKDAAIFRLNEGIVSSSKPMALDTVILYPNPTSELLHIKNDAGIKSITIFSTNGKVMKELKGKVQKDCLIKMGHYKKGVYLIALRDIHENVKTYKVIKE